MNLHFTDEFIVCASNALRAWQSVIGAQDRVGGELHQPQQQKWGDFHAQTILRNLSDLPLLVRPLHQDRVQRLPPGLTEEWIESSSDPHQSSILLALEDTSVSWSHTIDPSKEGFSTVILMSSTSPTARRGFSIEVLRCGVQRLITITSFLHVQNALPLPIFVRVCGDDAISKVNAFESISLSTAIIKDRGVQLAIDHGDESPPQWCQETPLAWGRISSQVSSFDSEPLAIGLPSKAEQPMFCKLTQIRRSFGSQSPLQAITLVVIPPVVLRNFTESVVKVSITTPQSKEQSIVNVDSLKSGRNTALCAANSDITQHLAFADSSLTNASGSPVWSPRLALGGKHVC
jgi:hypothetical protein